MKTSLLDRLSEDAMIDLVWLKIKSIQTDKKTYTKLYLKSEIGSAEYRDIIEALTRQEKSIREEFGI